MPVHAAERAPLLVEAAAITALAEDEPAQRLLLAQLLTRAGHLVDAVSDGHEALRLIRAGGHPLPITDWDMPGLDRFKSVNDAWGHQVGDEVLVRVLERISACVRQHSDWLARFGGEEFVLVLPETDLKGAVATAERIRSALAAAPVGTSAGELPITASFGAASLEQVDRGEPRLAERLLRLADLALYTSKASGRNRVTQARAEAVSIPGPVSP